MKKPFLNNLKYFAFSFAILLALGTAHADPFTAPSASSPSSNVPLPLHTGPDQVKDGALSVNTFAAYQNAAFMQQTFFNGIVFGGKPGDASSTVLIGDNAAPANISVDGSVSVVGTISSASVTGGALCATTSGTIVICAGGGGGGTPPPPPPPPPELTQISNQQTSWDPNTVVEEFQVGSSVEPGDQFTMTGNGNAITITAGPGDTDSSIAQNLQNTINQTNWNIQSGAPGTSSTGSASFTITVNTNYQFYGWANR